MRHPDIIDFALVAFVIIGGGFVVFSPATHWLLGAAVAIACVVGFARAVQG
jgi:hypothetical protein